MKISMVSFTKNGSILSKKLYTVLKSNKYDVNAYSLAKFCEDKDCLQPLGKPLTEWTKEQFVNKDAILFIGACAIAVRSIAPYLKDKTKDPAVLVIDEQANYVIPILSGHLGGANELAGELATYINASPIITTATDINKLFAVDVFAKQNRLHIMDMKIAKMISAELLEGKNIGLTSDGNVQGSIPEYLKIDETSLEYGIAITCKTNCKPYANTLSLVPKTLSVGIGCRKGKSVQEIEEIFLKVIEDNNIAIQAIANVASIDLKKSEEGILAFCQNYQLPAYFYEESELSQVEGEFTSSHFVKEITGVNNVCERAAVKASGDGKLLIKKYAENGVTIAIAEKEWCVHFE